MSFQRKCSVCGREFWHAEHRNYNRKNLTCGPECRLKQRVQRNKERRYRLRMEKLALKAKRNGARKKPARGTVRRPRQLSITKKHARKRSSRKRASV